MARALRRQTWIFLSLAACGGGSVPRCGAADEAAQIEALVTESQRAGFERHDLEGYMRPWADDGQLVSARGEQAGPHDHIIGRAQNEAVKRIRFAGPSPTGTSWSLAEPEVEVTGDQAVLKGRVTHRMSGDEEVVRERYTLRRHGETWQITENRWWLVQVRFGGESIEYDEVKWAALDAAVDEAKQTGDLEHVAAALAAALRVAEAHAAWKEITELPNAAASSWTRRGYAALGAGDADDAVLAFRRARDLGETLDDAVNAYLARGDR
jgi:hypothetical protein